MHFCIGVSIIVIQINMQDTGFLPESFIFTQNKNKLKKENRIKRKIAIVVTPH